MSHPAVFHAVAICIAIAGGAACRGSGGDSAGDAGRELIDAAPDVKVDATPPRNERFRMATWNLGCLLDDDESVYCNTTELGETYIRTQAHLDELAAHGEMLDADMVFVQEVENPAALNLVFPGWEVQTVGTGIQQVGIAVSPSSSATLISVAPLDSLEVSPGLRAGLVATIEFQQEQIQILAVHLKPGCIVSPLDSGDLACDILVGQLNVIVDWIEERRSLDEMFMLTGDFNRIMEGGEDFFTTLQDAAGGGLYRTTSDRETTCWHHHPDAPQFTNYIDHHIASEDVVARFGLPIFELHNFSALYEDAWIFLSDHCPIVAEL